MTSLEAKAAGAILMELTVVKLHVHDTSLPDSRLSLSRLRAGAMIEPQHRYNAITNANYA